MDIDLQNASFEELLAALEERVRALETGDMPLEQALAVYEEGVALTRACHERLDATEQRLVELTRAPDGSVQETEGR